MAFSFSTNPRAIAPGQRYRDYDDDDMYNIIIKIEQNHQI